MKGKTMNGEFNKQRRIARHLFHQNEGKISFVVVCNNPEYYGKKNKFLVVQSDVYSSHSSIKEKYPFIWITYQ